MPALEFGSKDSLKLIFFNPVSGGKFVDILEIQISALCGSLDCKTGKKEENEPGYQ